LRFTVFLEAQNCSHGLWCYVAPEYVQDLRLADPERSQNCNIHKESTVSEFISNWRYEREMNICASRQIILRTNFRGNCMHPRVEEVTHECEIVVE
jgi:hypothetical protein